MLLASPRKRPETTPSSAVLETFFGGSLEDAIAAHLHSRKDRVSVEERERLIELIEQAHKEGR